MGKHMVLISTDALHMLIASSVTAFTLFNSARVEQRPDAPSREEVETLQQSIREGLQALGQHPSPSLARVLATEVW
jgi:hypothetical protein